MPKNGIQLYNRKNIQRELRTLIPGDVARQCAIENIIEGTARRAWAEAVAWAAKEQKKAQRLRRWPSEMRQHASHEFFTL